MSELTQCNYCTLKDIHDTAKQYKQTVKTSPAPKRSFPNGVEVTVDGAFTAWFAKLPQECMCDG